MAIGDNVFQVRPNEGNGSSFILGENTALQHLLRQDEIKAQEERAASKQLQDQLVGLVSSTKDALPLHTKELTDRYSKIVDWYKEKRASGEKFKTGSDAQLEMQMKLGELQGATAKAKMWKNLALDATKKFNPDTDEQESFTNLQKYLNETGVDDIDYKAIPSLSKQLDPDKYIKNVEGNLQVQEDYDYKNPISIVNGVASVPVHQYKDRKAATKSVMEDESTDGIKFKKQAFKRFLKLPEKEQAAIITGLSKDNLSVQNDPAVLQDKVTEYMVDNSFKGKLLDKKDFKNVYDQERLAYIKSALSKSGKSFDQVYKTVPVLVTVGGGREEFNKKWKEDYTEDQWKEMGGTSIKSGQTGYVAFEPKSGKADTESVLLKVDGKPFKPMGYKLQDGKVFATGAMTYPEFNPSSGGYIDKYKPVDNKELEGENLANVAGHYGFDTVEDFKKKIEEESAKVAGVKKVAAKPGKVEVKKELTWAERQAAKNKK